MFAGFKDSVAMSLDVQSINDAVSAFGDDAAEFIRLTVKDADSFVAEIADGLKAADAVAVHDAAHSLKGILRQVGAASIADMAFGIETAASTGDLTAGGRLAQPLSTAYAALRDYLIRHG